MASASELRDPQLLRALAQRLRAMTPPPAILMEVCGTHTVAIARHGLREALPPGVRLISGPGCPVCVTPQEQIDRFIALGRVESVMLATFGDMMRVPGSVESLERARADGVDVLVVYSPLDAVAAAERRPEREVIFFGIGFETTAPAVALAITEAKRKALANFSVLAAHKLIPPAMMALVAGDVNVDGFLCPGHVSVIIGSNAYAPIARGLPAGLPAGRACPPAVWRVAGRVAGKSCVVAGFEPADILRGLEMLLLQIQQGRSEVESEYRRAVRPEGNPRAQDLIAQVFHPVDARWRGLGEIPMSGLALQDEFADFDATRRFRVDVPPAKEPPGCRCGDVLRGAIDPHQCPLFGQACTPANPVGACMVSSEGACQAHYRYRGDADQ